MGIFGALTTAVGGMRAQSFALENVSGNIANSQTTAFKRIDTAFVDLIPDGSPSKQLSGNVTANSRSTNTVQGDVQSASISTFMAINGDGFFVVQKPQNFVDNNPVFAGVENYTRRGDFQVDKNGYLVNGAGYYLQGIPIDSDTGNLVGSVPQLLQFQNDFLPAQATTTIDYRANLARTPKTNEYDADVVGSELLNPAAFSANPLALPPQAAKITGFGSTLLGDANVTLDGTAVLPGTLVNGGTFPINGTPVVLTVGMTPAQVDTAIDAALNPSGDVRARLRPAATCQPGRRHRHQYRRHAAARADDRNRPDHRQQSADQPHHPGRGGAKPDAHDHHQRRAVHRHFRHHAAGSLDPRRIAGAARLVAGCARHRDDDRRQYDHHRGQYGPDRYDRAHRHRVRRSASVSTPRPPIRRTPPCAPTT